MIYLFSKTTNYKEQFSDAVTRLVRDNDKSADEKNKAVNILIEAYVQAIGERPDLRELDELASWIIFGTKGVSTRKKIEIKAQEALEKREEEGGDYGACAA